MDVNEHSRLSNFTLITQVKKQLHKLYAFIAILHFTVTIGSSIIRIIYILDGCEIGYQQEQKMR